MLPVFPYSPLPGGMTREAFWNGANNVYDNGEMQGFTNFVKPLMRYTIPLSLYTEIKQSSVWAFFSDTTQGMVKPFLLKDPYLYAINSVVGVQSGVTNAATMFLFDTNSYMVRADTLSIGSLFSASSGYVRLGVEYGYSTDTGVLTVNTKAVSDVWGVRSATYYRKVKLTSAFVETAAMWNTFGSGLTLQELP